MNSGFQRGPKTHLDNEGNVFICGQNFSVFGIDIQLFVSKYDSLGTKLWETNFNTNVHDSFTDSAIDSEGNIIILGLHSDVIGNVRTFELIKIGNDGNILWEIFDDTNPVIRTVYKKISIDEFDNIYCMGGMANQADEVTFLVTKFSSDGNLEWENEFQLSNSDDGSNINFKVLEDKIVVFFKELSKHLIQEIDFNGETIQTTSSQLEHQTSQYSTIDEQGNLYIGHFSEYRVSKMGINGDSLWTYYYPPDSATPPSPSTTSANLTLLQTDDSGNIYVCGAHYSDADGKDFTVTKLNENGEVIWQTNYFSEGNLATSIAELDNFIAIVGGTNNDTINYNANTFLSLYSKETGEQLLEKLHNYQNNISDISSLG